VGWATGFIHDSFEGVYRLGSSKHHSPGQYELSGYGKDSVTGGTNGVMYPSVRVKMRIPAWKSPALEGFQPVLDEKEPGKWNWVKKVKGSEKLVVIPEYQIKEMSWEGLTLTKRDWKKVDDTDWMFVPVFRTSFWRKITRTMAQVLWFSQ
jgi:hypothetical protein